MPHSRNSLATSFVLTRNSNREKASERRDYRGFFPKRMAAMDSQPVTRRSEGGRVRRLNWGKRTNKKRSD